MRKNLMIVISILLCAALLTGCGQKASGVPAATEQPRSDATAAPEAQQTVWQAQFVPLKSGELQAGLRGGAARGETLYYVSSGVIADETPEGVTPEWPEQYWVYGPILVKTGPDGAVETIPYTPEKPEAEPGVNSGVMFERLSAEADSSLWVLENHYRVDEQSGAGREEKVLVHLGEDGSVLNTIPLHGLAAIEAGAGSAAGSYSFTVPGFAGDGQGRLCLAIHEWAADNGGYAQSNRVCVLDEASGAVGHMIELDGEAAALVRLGNGAIAVASYRGATPVISLLDPEKGTLTEVTSVDDFLTDVVGGEGDSLCYSAGDSFFRLHTATGEAEKLFSWSGCDVARSYDDSGVCVLGDGRVVATAEGELILLAPAEASQVQERKTLRLAVTNLYPFTSQMVSRFNRSQSEYRIEITDYSQYNDYTSANPEDWNAGLTKLQTELIAGNVPDIIDISLLPASRLGEKGLLEDLMPYIDADGELSREQLNMHVLDAFSDNGKLYQTVGNYYILTTLGLRDVVGDRMGWTMADLTAAMGGLQAQNPESTVFDVYTTRDDALNFLLYLQMADYVDWSTGACSFDSESFRNLLSFVHDFPTTFDWGADATPQELDSDLRMLQGLQLMKQCNLSCFEDVQINTAGLGGAACTFVGYPTEEGVGSMFAQIGNAFAISSSCQEKEAAWAFVRQFFLPAYQEQLSGSVFPTNLGVYEEMKQAAQHTGYKRNPDGSFALDADGNRIEDDRGSVAVAGTTVKLRAATAEEIALVEELTAATTRVLTTDDSLKEILLSSAEAYFADQRSVEETVRQIQSRASLYVNEQR